MKRRGWLIVTLIALLVVIRRRPHADPCALAQTWTAGDVHQYERLALSADGTGHWILGSYDSEIEPDAQDFAWSASGSTMTFDRTSVRYALERIGTRCRLTMDASPLPRSRERYWYTGGL